MERAQGTKTDRPTPKRPPKVGTDEKTDTKPVIHKSTSSVASSKRSGRLASQEEENQSPFKFFFYWFGVPLILLIGAMVMMKHFNW